MMRRQRDCTTNSSDSVQSSIAGPPLLLLCFEIQEYQGIQIIEKVSMSSTSPFKKKELKELGFGRSIENIENMPRTFKELQEQKTCRTIVDSEAPGLGLGESRKTIVSEMRESRKESLSFNEDIIRLKEAQILKLEESLFLERGINECLRDQISKNKQMITHLVQQLDEDGESEDTAKDQMNVVGILKNPVKKQEVEEIKTLRFKSHGASLHLNVESENKKLRRYIKSLEDNLERCKGFLQDLEEKSRVIESEYQGQIRSLKAQNQYLVFQIQEFS